MDPSVYHQILTSQSSHCSLIKKQNTSRAVGYIQLYIIYYRTSFHPLGYFRLYSDCETSCSLFSLIASVSIHPPQVNKTAYHTTRKRKFLHPEYTQTSQM